MTKVLLTILYYMIMVALIFASHDYFPTNRAGFGFDIVVYFVSVIISIGLLARSLIKKDDEEIKDGRIVLVSLAGTLMVIGAIFFT